MPRRWRLHRRGHSLTTAHDTPKRDMTKSDTSPTSTSETPKSEEPPAKAQSNIQSKNGNSQLDYFFGPWIDPFEEEQRAHARLATKGITLPLDEYKALQIRLADAQLKQTKIEVLQKELKEAKEELHELRKRGNTLATTIIGDQGLISDTVGNSQPPSPPLDAAYGQMSD